MNIPNLLTTLRILFVPCFVYVYWTVPPSGFYWPVVILALSGLTDVADGMIARKFNMITPLGRFLDPVADKLTIGAVVVCLAVRHPILWVLFALYAVKSSLFPSVLFRLNRGEIPSRQNGTGRLPQYSCTFSCFRSCWCPGFPMRLSAD